MKKIFIFAAFIVGVSSLTSCGALASMSEEDAFKVGYNTGVMLRGGSSDEYIY